MSLIDAGGGRLWCTVYPTRVNAFLYESWLYGISEAVTSLLALPSRDLLWDSRESRRERYIRTPFDLSKS